MSKFSVSDLDLYYGNFQALKKIRMEIPENEITAFIGPSGCGKSTFLKTVSLYEDHYHSIYDITICLCLTVMGSTRERMGFIRQSCQHQLCA